MNRNLMPMNKQAIVVKHRLIFSSTQYFRISMCIIKDLQLYCGETWQVT